MARYSIDETTLTALGDAVRSKTGETEYRDVSYTSKTYHFDSDIYNSKSTCLRIPVCGATQIKITKLATNCTGSESFFVADCECVEMIYPQLQNEGFTLYNFTTSSAGLYVLASGLTYDFEATWYDADGNQMEVTFSDEVPKTMTPERMATEINGLQAMTASLLNLTDDISYKFYGGKWDEFLNNYGDQITTSNITHLSNSFFQSKVTNIPFEINCNAEQANNLGSAFEYCTQLLEPPVINNCKPNSIDKMFASCQMIRYFPDNYGEDWDWSYHTTATSQYNGAKDEMFSGCYSLRKLPMGLFKYGNPVLSYSDMPFRGLTNLYSLDEIVDMPCPHTAAYNATSSSRGIFYNSLTGLHRCKEFTFAPDIGVKQWAKQVLDLSKLGYGYSRTNFYNSGITADKEVNSGTTYVALKDDPDWFAVSADYSRYSMDAMIRTINSLPDCSEYAAANGTNTIKFNMTAGRGYGKNISSLPEDIAAIATAKGWTVSFV